MFPTPQRPTPQGTAVSTDPSICGGDYASHDINAHPHYASPAHHTNAMMMAREDVSASHDTVKGLSAQQHQHYQQQQQQQQQQHLCSQRYQQRWQQHSGSDSADNSTGSQWRVPTRVATPLETLPPPASTALSGTRTSTVNAAAAAPGVVRIGGVEPSRVHELTPFINALRGIRAAPTPTANTTGGSAATYDGAAQSTLDFTFFADGPYGGQGFICFYSPAEAEEAVRACPGALAIVGQREPYMQLSIRVSSLGELMMVRQYYQDSARQLSPLAPAQTLAPAVEETFVFWLRGLPFQTERRDVEEFLKRVPYHRLDVGVLGSGECSGNAFVELTGSEERRQLEELNNTFIPCAAHAALPALERPKPRYVEVILTTPERRQEQLSIDRTMVRNLHPYHPRVRLPATRVASSSFPPMPRYGEARHAVALQSQQQQQQQQVQPQLQQQVQPHLQLQQQYPQQRRHQHGIATAPSSFYLVHNGSQVIGVVANDDVGVSSQLHPLAPAQPGLQENAVRFGASPAFVMTGNSPPQAPTFAYPVASAVPHPSAAMPFTQTTPSDVTYFTLPFRGR